MLSTKALISKILKWCSAQGASSQDAVNYGVNTSITPSRSGWLVAKGKVTSQQTIQPIIRITQGGNIVSEGIGLVTNATILHTACYVRKGVTYSIVIYRADLQNVTLY